MKRGQLFAASAAVAALLGACAAHQPSLTLRERTPALAEGQQTAAFRVAEARSYFQLGSIGLATEGFRRALREDPASVDALNGLAACYDQLGRFDLSRSYYERALALAPTDARLYANLATSLTMQGRKAEAAAVRAEMASRLAAGREVSVALGAPVQAPAPVAQSEPVPAPAPSASLPLDAPSRELAVAERPFSGPRLERVNMAEMILVTSPATRLPIRVAEARPSRPVPNRPAPMLAAISPVPVRPAPAPVRVVNAARLTRLAANTRSQLQSWGWRTVAIANAPATAERSAILFPERRRKEAQQLGRRLGIDLHMQVAGQGGELVVRLGRDMAKRRISA